MHPNKNAMLQHLNFLFGNMKEYSDGFIEIAYTSHDSNAVNRCKFFAADDIEGATDFAAQINSRDGVNVYVGAALRLPNTLPDERADIHDYYVASYIWADLDDEGMAEAAAGIYKNLPPSFIVVTGRTPWLRMQAWWKLMYPAAEADREAHKANLAHIRAALRGDPSVVDPIRVMRLAGSIAYPKKKGRVVELTELIIPEKPTLMVMAERFKSHFPNVPSPLTTVGTSGGVDSLEKQSIRDNKPRNPITGTLQIETLLDATGGEGHWHINMRDAVASMVGKGWTDEAIHIVTKPYLRDNSLTCDMITPLITSARRKWDKPDTPDDVTFDPVTGEVLPLSPEHLPMIDPTALQGLLVPPRQWIVPDWIPVGYATSLYGDGGTGKSLLAMQLMTSAATGKPWLGIPVAPIKTLGFFCEDAPDELHRRQAEINNFYGIDFSDLENMKWASRVAEDNILMTFKDNGSVGALTEIFRRLEQSVRDFGAQLVVIDTAADTFGGNENVRPQVRQFISGALNRLAQNINGAVLLCAHPSVAGINDGGGYGGSTAWNNSVRSRMYLSRPKPEEGGLDNSDLRILSRKKANYARLNEDINLVWQNGAFVPQSFGGGMVVDSNKHFKQKLAEDCFLKALADFEAQGRPLSVSNNAGNYAPKAVKTNSHCFGFNKAELEGAMNRLFERNVIKNVPYGRGSNRPKKIVKVEQSNNEEGCDGVL